MSLKAAPLRIRKRARPLAQPRTSNTLIASLAQDLAGAMVREPSQEEWQTVSNAIRRLDVNQVMATLMGHPHEMAEAWAERHVQAFGAGYERAANEELARLGVGMTFSLYRKHAIEKAAKGGSRRRPDKPYQPRTGKTLNRFTGVPHEDTFIRERAGKLITRLNAEQRNAIREQLIARYNREKKPETLVRDLRRSIGLDAPRARALRNFEDAARANGTKNVDAQVERYRQQLIRNRAETIARTESTAIENQGRIQAWETAIDTGDLPVDAEQEWVTSGEPCPDCEAMDGQRVPVGESFSSPAYGVVDQPPLHPRCYCVLVVRAFK